MNSISQAYAGKSLFKVISAYKEKLRRPKPAEFSEEGVYDSILRREV